MIKLIKKEFDTNKDGKLSHKEIADGLHADTKNMRAESCDASTAATDAELIASGMTDRLYFAAEGKQLSKVQNQLATGLSKDYNEALDDPLVKKAFPGGSDKTIPNDFKALAKAIGEKVRDCGLLPPPLLPDSFDKEYVTRPNLPHTADISDKTPKR